MPGLGQPGCTIFQSPEEILKRWPELDYLPRPEPPRDYQNAHAQWMREYEQWQGLHCETQRGAYFCRRHGKWITCIELMAKRASPQHEEGTQEHKCPPSHKSWEKMEKAFYKRQSDEVESLTADLVKKWGKKKFMEYNNPRSTRSHQGHESALAGPTPDPSQATSYYTGGAGGSDSSWSSSSYAGTSWGSVSTPSATPSSPTFEQPQIRHMPTISESLPDNSNQHPFQGHDSWVGYGEEDQQGCHGEGSWEHPDDEQEQTRYNYPSYDGGYGHGYNYGR